jgi:4'-phosphopantetheinyl transferase
VTLWWGGPELAAQYRAEVLQSADRLRALRARSPRAERDWRVSRALLQQVASACPPGAADARSLSHARGHAVVGTAPAGWRIGVDLEAIRPRDVDALAAWCCSREESDALACRGGDARLRGFYLLWTLKEAFIKAANLDFPADMRAVGLWPGTGAASDTDSRWSGWRLRAPGAGWQAWSAVIDDAWVASAVWLPPDPENPGAPGWRTAEGAAPPRVIPAGRWT